MPKETVNGELKVSFNLFNNFPEVPGKNLPFIELTVTNYAADGTK